MRKKLFLSCFIAIAGLTACSNSDDGGQVNNAEQVFEINISNASGNTLTRAGRPLYGSQAKQNVDEVVVYIIDKGTNRVVHTRTIYSWMDDSTVIGNARKFTFRLTGNDKLVQGDYKLAAYAYSDGGQKSEKLELNGDLATNKYEIVFPDKAEEFFAGETNLVVGENNKFTEGNEVILERHVAGAFGYFTNIPAEVLGDKTDRVRLVASVKNTVAKFVEPQLTQVNGDIPATGESGVQFKEHADSNLDELAFEVYSAKVSEWFLNGDTNNNGLLDAADEGWINPKLAAGLKVKVGTIMAGEFLVASKKHNSWDTFELQLLTADGKITKSWKVATPNISGGESSKYRYDIYRNHLYGIGEKTADAPEDPENPIEPGKENPEDLSKNQDIIINISSEWEVLHKLELE